MTGKTIKLRGEVSLLPRYRLWLTSDDPNHRDTAIHIFMHAQIVDPELIQIINEVLRTDDKVKVRRTAVDYLGNYVENEYKELVIESLQEALEDEDYIVRGKALLGLVKIHPLWYDDDDIVKYMKEETHPFGRFCINQVTKDK